MDLAVDVVENAHWNPRVVLQKAAVLPQHTALNGKAEAVAVTAPAKHLAAVGLGERPVACQFLFARVFRQGDVPAPRRAGGRGSLGHRSRFSGLRSKSSAISSAEGLV